MTLSTVLMLAGGLLLFWLLIVRPASKQQKAIRDMQSSVAPGSRVQIGNSFLGTVLHVGDRQAIIEIAPGVEVTVPRAGIARVLGADDEEFEYADESGQLDGPETDAQLDPAERDGEHTRVATTSFHAGNPGPEESATQSLGQDATDPESTTFHTGNPGPEEFGHAPAQAEAGQANPTQTFHTGNPGPEEAAEVPSTEQDLQQFHAGNPGPEFDADAPVRHEADDSVHDQIPSTEGDLRQKDQW